MIHYLFIGATGLLATIGVGGTIAVIVGCIFIGPAAVSAFVTPLVQRFLACRWCDVALATVIALVASYWIGHHSAVLDCRAEALAAELAIKQADLDNAVKAKTDATARAKLIEANSNDQHDKDTAYIAKLEKRPACALDNNDIGTGGMRNHGFNLTKPARGTK